MRVLAPVGLVLLLLAGAASGADDAPIYAGKPVMDIQGADHTRTMLIQTHDAMDKVVEFYRKALSSNGWKVDSTKVTGRATAYIATKDQTKVTVAVSPATDGDGVMIAEKIGAK